MTNTNDESYLRHAINLAAEGIKDKNSPFGAVIVGDSEILSAERNRTSIERDSTSHAELVAIREACKKYGVEKLKNSTLYSSCEPCPMCLSAIYYAGIRRVVFAATLEDAINFNSGDPPLNSKFLNDVGSLGIEIIQGKQRNTVIELFQKYVDKYGHL